MIKLSKEYIKQELLKIAFLLESDYRELLDNEDAPHKAKIKNMLDSAPIDWVTEFSWVNDRKVQKTLDLDESDWTQDRHFRDRIKNIAVEGKVVGTDEAIKIKIIWGESEGQNKYILYKKNNSGDWYEYTWESSTDKMKKVLDGLSKEDSYDHTLLGRIYKIILDGKRKEIKSYLDSKLGNDFGWKLSPRSPAKKYSLEFTLLQEDEILNKNLVETIKREKIDEDLINFINKLIKDQGFNSKDYKLISSFEKKKGFSILLRSA